MTVGIFRVHEPAVNSNHELTVATSSNHLPDRIHATRRHVFATLAVRLGRSQREAGRKTNWKSGNSETDEAGKGLGCDGRDVRHRNRPSGRNSEAEADEKSEPLVAPYRPAALRCHLFLHAQPDGIRSHTAQRVFRGSPRVECRATRCGGESSPRILGLRDGKSSVEVPLRVQPARETPTGISNRCPRSLSCKKSGASIQGALLAETPEGVGPASVMEGDPRMED